MDLVLSIRIPNQKEKNVTDLIYAGVGSRRTPYLILASMTSMALQMAQSGWYLRSGFAEGADKAFGLGAAQHSDATGQELFMMYLPWAGFNGAPVNDPSFQVIEAYDKIYRLARDHHPNWHNLSDGVKMLMIRNAAIVAGPNLDSHADLLICWTPEAKAGGGTGHAIRVAKTLGVPVFDLASDYDQRAVVEFINDCEAKHNQELEQQRFYAEAVVEALGMANN